MEFRDRIALRTAKIRLHNIKGIDGNSRDGAFSIVLNGGYADDYDLGDEILYTGEGGNVNGRQVEDQVWNSPGNKALLISELNAIPVRVTRGYKHKSPLSPGSGYRYGGLYMVTDHFAERGRDGYLICRFKLVKADQMIANK